MKIIIEHVDNGYQVKITEDIAGDAAVASDDLHQVQKVTTSLPLNDMLLAKCWLAKWLTKY